MFCSLFLCVRFLYNIVKRFLLLDFLKMIINYNNTLLTFDFWASQYKINDNYLLLEQKIIVIYLYIYTLQIKIFTPVPSTTVHRDNKVSKLDIQALSRRLAQYTQHTTKFSLSHVIRRECVLAQWRCYIHSFIHTWVFRATKSTPRENLLEFTLALKNDASPAGVRYKFKLS